MIARRVTVRIGVAVTLFVLFVSGAQALATRVVLVRQALEVRRHITEEGIAMARLAARSGGDPAALRDELGELGSIAIVYYDRDGRMIARSRDDFATLTALTNEQRAAARAAGGAPHYLTPLARGARTEVIAATVDVDSTDVAAVAYVGLFEDSPVLATQSLRGALPIVFVLVSLAVAFVITWWLARRARASLARTERVVRRMSEGDLSVRLPESGDDEVGQLVADFNRMADRLAEHVERLEGEDERRRRLFAAFTHEINTPLTSVLGYLESLAMPDIEADPETRRRYLAIAYEQAQQLGALAEDLTTLSQLEYEGVALDQGDVDLRSLAEREVDAFRARAQARSVELAIEGEPTVVRADRNRLAQVLRILLDNAIRHTREGTTVKVVIGADGLEVIDRGEGIAAADLALLGTPLFRTDAARDRKRGGRGLGLAIARGLTKAHGGELTLRSSLGEGTSARVTLG